MSATNQKSTTRMSSGNITAAINMATLASADSTNKHSPPEPTNKESAPSSTQPTPKGRSKLSNNKPHVVVNKEVSLHQKSEVEVLGVKCSRILGIGTESRRSCPNMAVDSTRKRKTPYCKSCAEELKEIDRQRKKQKRAEVKKAEKETRERSPQNARVGSGRKGAGFNSWLWQR